jgi:hypothetical protein
VCDLANRLILFVACGEGNRERERQTDRETESGEKTRRHPIPSIRSDPLVGDSRKECRPAAARSAPRHAARARAQPSSTCPRRASLRVSRLSPPHQTYNSRPARGIPCHVASMLISSVPRRTSPGRPIHEGISFACGTNSVGG